MLQITIFTKRSIFLAFLITHSVNPLLANSEDFKRISSSKQEVLNKYKELASILVSNGLEEKAAIKKVERLFGENENLSIQLSELSTNTLLSISKEEINEALAKYALFEKSCDLNSYSSLIGLVQSIKKEQLSSEQLDVLKDMTTA